MTSDEYMADGIIRLRRDFADPCMQPIDEDCCFRCGRTFNWCRLRINCSECDLSFCRACVSSGLPFCCFGGPPVCYDCDRLSESDFRRSQDSSSISFSRNDLSCSGEKVIIESAVLSAMLPLEDYDAAAYDDSSASLEPKVDESLYQQAGDPLSNDFSSGSDLDFESDDGDEQDTLIATRMATYGSTSEQEPARSEGL